MSKYERVPVLRSNNVTLYGRVINEMGKLGRYEVISDISGHEGEYYSFSEAETRFNYLKSIGNEKEKR